MTIPITSFDDILDALDRDPALRDQLRRHILTEELLQLPAQFILLRTDASDVKAGLENLETQVTSMSGTVSAFAGAFYEDHASNLALLIIRDEMLITEPRTLARRQLRGELQDIVLSASKNGAITAHESNQLQVANLVVSGTDHNGDAVYVLAEISITVQDNDIDRARYRAQILQKATGVTTMAAAIVATLPEGPPPEDVRLLVIPTSQELDDYYRT